MFSKGLETHCVTLGSRPASQTNVLYFSLADVGSRGDVVHVHRGYGRNQLLAKDLAVYASPENKKMFEEEMQVSPTSNMRVCSMLPRPSTK